METARIFLHLWLQLDQKNNQPTRKKKQPKKKNPNKKPPKLL